MTVTQRKRLMQRAIHQSTKRAKTPRACILYEQFGGNPNYHTTKNCHRHKAISEKCKDPTSNNMSVEDLYASNLKLAKKLKKYKEKKCKNKYVLVSSDSDSGSSKNCN
eukprot:4918829-Ditylum_brightwellii.AAC.1